LPDYFVFLLTRQNAWILYLWNKWS